MISLSKIRFGKISPALFLVLMVFLVLVLLVPAALVSAAGTTVSTTTLSSSINPSVFGQTITLTATVAGATPAPSGQVTFLDGTKALGTASLSGSSPYTASLTIDNLTVAAHDLTAAYNGDTAYAASTSAPVSQVVNKASVTMTVTPSANPSVFGQPVTFTASLAAVAPGAGVPTGNILFQKKAGSDQGYTAAGAAAVLSAGFTVSSPVAFSAIGAVSVQAIYSGDANFNTATSTAITQTVNNALTACTVTSNYNPSTLGQAVIFTASVAAVSPGAGVPTGGTVQFNLDGAPFGIALAVSNGAVTSGPITSLTIGSHTVSAVYSGAANFNGSSSANLTQAVNIQPTITTTVLMPGMVGLNYSQTLKATGGSGTIIWSRSGSFPSGLTLDPSGAITGSPNTAATYTFTVRATDASGIIDSKSLSITINDSKYVCAWGSNLYGQLGNNSNAASRTPVGIYANSLSTAVSIKAGLQHSLSLDPNGNVWAWGYNAYGQLGNRTQSSSLLPVEVYISSSDAYLSNIIAISAGSNHSLALKSDGTVWAWGDNSFGQLGDSTLTPKFYAVRVTGLPTTIVAISAGGNYNLALTSDGYVWAWGDNQSGQLGNNTTSAGTAPLQVSNNTGTASLSGITAIAAGQNHSLALTSDSSIWAWGLNSSGQLGNNTLVNSLLPVQVRSSSASALNAITAISAGVNHSLAITSSGAVWAWGDNSYGQLGNNTFSPSSYAVQVKIDSGSPLSNVTSISAGQYFSLAASSEGYAWAWGNNDNGQLGNNDITNTRMAVQALTLGGSSFSYVAAVSAGGSHSLALTSNSNTTVSINDISLVTGMVGAAYTQTLTAAGGNGTYSWSIYSGTLPPGLYLGASTGVISGSLTTSGSYTFYVRVVSGASNITKQFTITINQYNPVSIATTSLAGGQVNKPYAAALYAAGGSGIFAWYTYSGTLPPGLSLTPTTGQISGTPTAVGNYSFLIKVTDNYDATLTSTVSLNINITPAVTISTISISGLTASAPLNTNQDGYTQSVSQLTTTDGQTALTIPAGIRMLDNAGNPLTTFSANKIAEPPTIPTGNALLSAYTFGPSGANFSSPITLTFKFNNAALPAGVQTNNLSVYYYNGSQWSVVPSTLDANFGTVSAAITHFSVYALMGKIIASPTLTQTVSPLPTVQPAPTPITVTAASPVKTTPPASSQPVNWGLVIPLILVVLILAVTLFFLIRKKNSMFH